MSPDQQRIAELERQVAELRNFMLSFANPSQITPETQRTIGQSLTGTSSKTPASATRAVNEAGGGSYNVMFPPDGFLSIGGKNVPYIN